MSTPSGVTIIARAADGREFDVTEGVQTLYDHEVHSMEWGSGFLTVEDAVPIAELARICGFEGMEEAERYIIERQREDYRRKRTEELLAEASTRPMRKGFPHVSTERRAQIFDQAREEAIAKFPDWEGS